MEHIPDDNLPWYKQFWPWFLILLPLTVVIASVITFFISQKNPPSLVTTDYYKEGLAININKQLEENAKKLGLSATVTIDSQFFTIQLSGLRSQPSQLLVDLKHATLSQYDQSLKLMPIANSTYQTPFQLPKPGKWYISIKEPSHAWEIKKTSLLKP
ncbi:MAG: FixH family protein [Cycloclasticus sp.]